MPFLPVMGDSFDLTDSGPVAALKSQRMRDVLAAQAGQSFDLTAPMAIPTQEIHSLTSPSVSFFQANKKTLVIAGVAAVAIGAGYYMYKRRKGKK